MQKFKRTVALEPTVYIHAKICKKKKKKKWTQTERLSQEDEAPDTGHVADDQADGQDDPLGDAATQPTHKEEAGDDFHAAEAVHDAVLQLAVAKVLLGQRRHHGLEGGNSHC